MDLGDDAGGELSEHREALGGALEQVAGEGAALAPQVERGSDHLAAEELSSGVAPLLEEHAFDGLLEVLGREGAAALPVLPPELVGETFDRLERSAEH